MKVWVVTGDVHTDDIYGAEINEIPLNQSIEEYVGGYTE